MLQLMKQLPNLDEKNKERPLCFTYSVKARALLHAHFARLELPPNTLQLGMVQCRPTGFGMVAAYLIMSKIYFCQSYILYCDVSIKKIVNIHTNTKHLCVSLCT